MGGPNQVCKTMEKMSKANQKKKIIVRIDNHAPTFDSAQNLNHTQCKSKGKLKMMLKKNGHVISLKYSLWPICSSLYQLSEWGYAHYHTRKRSSCTSLKWAWKDNEPVLFALELVCMCGLGFISYNCKLHNPIDASPLVSKGVNYIQGRFCCV